MVSSLFVLKMYKPRSTFLIKALGRKLHTSINPGVHRLVSSNTHDYTGSYSQICFYIQNIEIILYILDSKAFLVTLGVLLFPDSSNMVMSRLYRESIP